MTKYRVILAIMVLYSTAAYGQWRTYRTYVYETQEYRESTRWTLTEWLRIKERIKMMDVWLAMFSDPKKDNRFRPELNLSYGIHKGAFTVSGDNTHEGELSGKYAKGQLWLTNIITSTIGIRTLNIDIGGEAYLRLSDDAYDLATGASDITNTPINQNISARHYSLNLRLFGKSIQDSSIIVKTGSYQVINTLYLGENLYQPSIQEGTFMGAEMQFYLTKVLGFEGNYHDYQKQNNVAGSEDLGGTYYDYNVFLEVSLFRLVFGKYTENWTITDPNGSYNVEGSGYTGGLKLQF